MNFPTLYINNFFNNPDKVFEYSKTVDYFPPEKNEKWKGVRSKSFHIINKDLFDNIIKKVLSIYYNFNLEYVEWQNTYVAFHKINEPLNINDIHIDSDAVLAGIIYLNKNGDLSNGTTIYNNKKEILKIANHYNSLLCYDAKQLHGATGHYVKDEERLTIVFFIDILQVRETPLERLKRIDLINEF